MKQYSSYIDSGIQWLNEIPAHWKILPGRALFTENKEKNDGGEHQVLSLSYGSIIIKKNVNEGLIPENYSSYQYIRPGYIIVRCTDLQNDKVSLRTSISEYEGIITGAYLGLIPKPICRSKFIHYLLRAWDCSKELYRYGSGLRQSLSWNDFKYLLLPIPTPEEQDAIVAYLDAATAKIDEAIAQQQRMIDLLSERKQIIIDKTTTKGAFSGKELHDSGVDYIGEIPEGWTTTKIKFVASYNDEVLSEDSADKDIEYVEIGDVQYGKGITGSANYLFKDAPSRARRITRKGDIIVSTVRTYLKAVAVIKKDGLIVSTGFVVIRPKSNVDAQFLAYAILNSAIISEVEKNSVGTSYPAVNAWEVVDIKVPIPPIEEQKRIALYLSEIEKNTEKAIEGCGMIIQALQERKQIIINDVVTGKVKVV